MGWLDDFISGISGRGAEETTRTTLGILGFVFWVVVIIGVVFGGFLLFRILWNKFAYEGEFQIAPYRIIWMGKYGAIEGNLSKNDSFDEETMEGLEQQSELKIVSNIVKDQIKNNRLFVYNFKITDEGDILESFSKKVRIISPNDLTLPMFTWMDTKGKRNIVSILRREKRRNIVVYSSSKRETIFDEDGNEIDYWIVSPVPMTEAKMAIGLDGKAISPTPTHFIDIIKIEGGKALAQVATLAPILAESIRKFLNVKKERDDYAQLYDDEVEKYRVVNMEKENLKHDLAQKIYVGTEQKPFKPIGIMNFGWILATAITVFFFVIILPEYLPQMEVIIAQFVGMGVGLAIIGFLWLWYSDKQKAEMETKTEETVQ